jgi:hypothetical protein
MSDEMPKDPITSGIQTLPARGRLPNDGRLQVTRSGSRSVSPIWKTNATVSSGFLEARDRDSNPIPGPEEAPCSAAKAPVWGLAAVCGFRTLARSRRGLLWIVVD